MLRWVSTIASLLTITAVAALGTSDASIQEDFSLTDLAAQLRVLRQEVAALKLGSQGAFQFSTAMRASCDSSSDQCMRWP